MDTIKEKATAQTEALEEISTEIIPEQNSAVKNDADIDGFIELRQKFIAKVNAICIEGKDYHIIQGKKSLAKGGAEKIASIFHWTAKFDKDAESLEMLGSPVGLVALKCTLMNGQFVGEGRGAASLDKNAKDPNKTIKMAQKSAFIDAVLRASGLSDFFTQDLEDIRNEETEQRDRPTHNPYNDPAPNKGKTIQPSDKQVDLIFDLMDQKELTPEKLYDNGFDVKNLTGGKEGTASELIEWLFKYNPRQTYGTGISKLTPQQERFQKILQNFDQSTTKLEVELKVSELKTAYENKEVTEKEYNELLAVARKVYASLTPQDASLKKIADGINF